MRGHHNRGAHATYVEGVLNKLANGGVQRLAGLRVETSAWPTEAESTVRSELRETNQARRTPPPTLPGPKKELSARARISLPRGSSESEARTARCTYIVETSDVLVLSEELRG